MRRWSIRWLSAGLLALSLGGARPGDALIDAIKSGDLNAVQRALSAGADPNAADAEGRSPLRVAVGTAREDISALLIKNGATDDPTILLVEAVAAKSVPLATLFRARTGSVNVHLPDGTTPLHRAAQGGDPEIVKWLVKTGATLDIQREDGITPLGDATWYGNQWVVQYLIAHGANPNAATIKEKQTPLHWAAQRGDDRDVEHLLALGASPSTQNLSGQTPFNMALDNGKSYAAMLCHHYETMALQIKNRVTSERITPQSVAPIRFATKGMTVPKLGWTRVFTDPMENVPSKRWSLVTGDDRDPLVISSTPTGARNFLGKLGRESARLSLADLPPHRAVSVRFQLLVLDSWDGGRYGSGWDRWILEVVGGPRLIETTFYNNNEDTDLAPLPLQAFPGTVTQSFQPGMTGAIEKRTLGYGKDWDGNGKLYDRSAVYDIEVVFPHSSAKLALDFTGAANQETADESWGLDNVRVSVAR